MYKNGLGANYKIITKVFLEVKSKLDEIIEKNVDGENVEENLPNLPNLPSGVSTALPEARGPRNAPGKIRGRFD